ncbi:class I SAM-dependent methyltransferase [bacterium D16-51]|nr:class I SAM-dependent methyltransferase [bacterium D16-59]RKI60196.1 class I SAM-dependent methyltransferase [bacterium D16-51]
MIKLMLRIVRQEGIMALFKKIVGKLKKVCKYRGMKHISRGKWEKNLKKKTICLGKFFQAMQNVGGGISLRDMTFIPGGSLVLDYLLLKEIMVKYGLQNYLEIGTFIGESISCMEEVSKKRISITLPPDAPELLNYFDTMETGNYANKLVSDDVIQYFADSKKFDFSKIKERIDLYFIDGDHSYEGVYTDTKKVFNHKSKDSFVVWHDFKFSDMSIRREVVQAVVDAIGLEQFKRVYCCDNNMCGIYVPDKYRKDFNKLCHYNPDILYTYNLKLEIHE